jgi:hypothetical protein
MEIGGSLIVGALGIPTLRNVAGIFGVRGKAAVELGKCTSQLNSNLREE